MYKCPKCGGNGRKERLEVEDMDGNQVNPSTGDIKCDDCGYIGSKMNSLLKRIKNSFVIMNNISIFGTSSDIGKSTITFVIAKILQDYK